MRRDGRRVMRCHQNGVRPLCKRFSTGIPLIVQLFLQFFTGIHPVSVQCFNVLGTSKLFDFWFWNMSSVGYTNYSSWLAKLRWSNDISPCSGTWLCGVEQGWISWVTLKIEPARRIRSPLVERQGTWQRQFGTYSFICHLTLNSTSLIDIARATYKHLTCLITAVVMWKHTHI